MTFGGLQSTARRAEWVKSTPTFIQASTTRPDLVAAEVRFRLTELVLMCEGAGGLELGRLAVEVELDIKRRGVSSEQQHP
jgi:hypothetical protein